MYVYFVGIKEKNCVRRKLSQLEFQVSSYVFKKGLNTGVVPSIVKGYGSHAMCSNWKVRGNFWKEMGFAMTVFNLCSSG